MNEPEPDPPDDPWMTIAEFADAMRVRPVTVRSWITKGQLRATRAGQRKWLVRHSELGRMLGQAGPPAAVPPSPVGRVERPDSDDYPPEVWEKMAKDAAEFERERLGQDYAMAGYEWDIALAQSRMAPPDARFAIRIRQIAQAAGGRAAAIRDCLEDSSFVWTPLPDSQALTLSYELRPGGNRPGPKDAWDRVDRTVTRLGKAMEGTLASAVAGAFTDLARAMNDVAEAIEHRPARPPDVEDGGSPAVDTTG